jgi:hypothetical protein
METVKSRARNVDVGKVAGCMQQREAIENPLNEIGTKATALPFFPELSQRFAAERNQHQEARFYAQHARS